MNSTRLLASSALFALFTAACGSPVLPQDSGRADTAISQADASDSATTDAGSTPDATAMMDVAASDVATLPDAASDVSAPPMDVASDRPTPTDSGLFCNLPLGGTCPAGTTCPAGDGCNRCSCPEGGGAAACTRIACPPDAGGGECTTAADCRLFESYCASDPCSCVALTTSAPDPRCSGAMVTCFVPPCRGRTADCVGGRCVVSAM